MLGGSSDKDRIRREIIGIMSGTPAGGLTVDAARNQEKNHRKAKKFTSKLFGLFDEKVEIAEFPPSNQSISKSYQVKRDGVFQDIAREDIYPGDIIRMRIEQSFPCDCVAYNNKCLNLDDFYTLRVDMGSPTVLKVSGIHQALTTDDSQDIPLFRRGDAYYGVAKTEKAFDYVYSKIALDSRLAEYTQSEIAVLKDRATALPDKDDWSEDEMRADGMAIFIRTINKELNQKKEKFDNAIKETTEFLDFIAVYTGKNCQEEKALLLIESNNKSIFRSCKVETVYI